LPQECKTHVTSVLFAEYGTVIGDCAQGLSTGKCKADFRSKVSKACIGQTHCALSCVQGGPNRCTVNDQLIVPSPDPCDGVGKRVGLQIVCATAALDTTLVTQSMGSDSKRSIAPPPRPGCDPQLSYCNSTLPDVQFITSVTNAYQRGRASAIATDANLSDIRALEGTTAGSPRTIGKLADTVIIAVDVAVPRASQNRHYKLSAYFVDWERQGRVNSVTLMNATDSTFTTIAPSQLLRDFGDGVWLSWNTSGSVRIRVAHVGGDQTIRGGGGGSDCSISAVAFDDV
jgi:hypothetical protein